MSFTQFCSKTHLLYLCNASVSPCRSDSMALCENRPTIGRRRSRRMQALFHIQEMFASGGRCGWVRAEPTYLRRQARYLHKQAKGFSLRVSGRLHPVPLHKLESQRYVLQRLAGISTLKNVKYLKCNSLFKISLKGDGHKGKSILNVLVQSSLYLHVLQSWTKSYQQKKR